MNVSVEHEVEIGDFEKWLDKTNGSSSPRELAERKRIKINPRYEGLTAVGLWEFRASIRRTEAARRQKWKSA